jgi:hypothetical protein
VFENPERRSLEVDYNCRLQGMCGTRSVTPVTEVLRGEEPLECLKFPNVEVLK